MRPPPQGAGGCPRRQPAVPGGTAGAFPGARPPPGGPSTPSLSQPRARMPLVVTITGSGSPRGCARPRLTAALRGDATHCARHFGISPRRHVQGCARSAIRGLRARHAASPALAWPSSSRTCPAIGQITLLGVLALTEHRDLAEIRVPDLAPLFPPGPEFPPRSPHPLQTGAASAGAQRPVSGP